MRGHKQVLVNAVADGAFNANGEPKRLLKKHVALIHSSGKLTLLERKLLNVLLLQAYDNLLTQRVHTIPLDLLQQLVGYDSNDRRSLRDALKALTITPIEFNLLDDEIEEDDLALPTPERPAPVRRGAAKDADSPWGVATLVSSVELRHNVCEYAFIEKQAERYYNPKIWALINIVTQRNFTSSFGLDLYENCLRFQRINKTAFWDIDTFRELVGATSSIYDDFRRLRNKVINVAVAQVNKFSDIEIEPEFKRGTTVGHPVIAIRFHIRPNPQKTIFAPVDHRVEAMKDTEAYKRLVALGCAESLAMSAVSRDAEFALRIARYTENKNAKGGLKNAGGYAASLLAKGDKIKLGKESSQPAAPTADETRAPVSRASLVQAFEKDRRTRVLAMASEGELEALRREWIAKTKDENPALLANRINADGSLKGLALSAFEVHAVQRLAGPYTDKDVDEWAQERGKQQR